MEPVEADNVSAVWAIAICVAWLGLMAWALVRLKRYDKALRKRGRLQWIFTSLFCAIVAIALPFAGPFLAVLIARMVAETGEDPSKDSAPERPAAADKIQKQTNQDRINEEVDAGVERGDLFQKWYLENKESLGPLATDLKRLVKGIEEAYGGVDKLMDLWGQKKIKVIDEDVRKALGNKLGQSVINLSIDSYDTEYRNWLMRHPDAVAKIRAKMPSVKLQSEIDQLTSEIWAIRMHYPPGGRNYEQSLARIAQREARILALEIERAQLVAKGK